MYLSDFVCQSIYSVIIILLLRKKKNNSFDMLRQIGKMKFIVLRSSLKLFLFENSL